MTKWWEEHHQAYNLVLMGFWNTSNVSGGENNNPKSFDLSDRIWMEKSNHFIRMGFDLKHPAPRSGRSWVRSTLLSSLDKLTRMTNANKSQLWFCRNVFLSIQVASGESRKAYVSDGFKQFRNVGNFRTNWLTSIFKSRFDWFWRISRNHVSSIEKWPEQHREA